VIFYEPYNAETASSCTATSCDAFKYFFKITRNDGGTGCSNPITSTAILYDMQLNW